MALFEQLILQLDEYERESFRAYTGKSAKSNLELKLFNYVVNNEGATPLEAMKHLYGKINREAYKRTQQRLCRKLTDFTLHLSQENTDEQSDVLQDMVIARRLLKRQCWAAALHFLHSAESRAQANRQYELLDTVYCLLGRHAFVLGLEPESVEQKRLANRRRYDAWCSLDLAFSRLAFRHEQARKDGVVLNIRETLKEALSVCRPSREDANDPAFMHRFVQLIRNVATSNKAYIHFERIVSRIYSRLKKSGAFEITDVDSELGFLYMLAHAQFRNAKFGEAMHTLDRAMALKASLSIVPVSIVRKLVALKASILNGTGRAIEAVALLEETLAKRGRFESDRELLNMQLSLAAYHYNIREYKKAMKVLSGFPYDVNALGKLMGTEWRFKLEMFELISYYDRGFMNEAQNLLQRIREYYAGFFRHDQYARVEIYLNFIGRMINDPMEVHTEAFRQDVKQARLNLSGAEEDIQAIAFYCWLTSKMFQRDYYEVFLNAINWKIGEGELAKVKGTEKVKMDVTLIH